MKSTYFHYALSEALSRVLPLGAAYGVGRAVAGCIYAVSPGERKTVEENLRAILGGASDGELRAKAKEVYVNFSRYCVDLLYIGKPHGGQNGGGPAGRVTFENKEAVERSLARGKGAVVVTAHLGHWELAAMALARHHPVSVVANRHADERVDRLFMQRRARHGVRVIPGGFALRPSLEALAQNEIVGITGDREFSKNGGTALEFFGRPARLPRGAAALSARSGAPIVGCSILGGEDGRWRVRFEDPVFPDGLSEEDLQRRTVSFLEDAIRRDPTRWFVFDPFWSGA